MTFEESVLGVLLYTNVLTTSFKVLRVSTKEDGCVPGV